MNRKIRNQKRFIYIATIVFVVLFSVAYSASYIDKTRAKIDGGTSSPGYFTRKT